MPPRTRACAICRKKRIKCDATLPHCLMCIRTNRQCPGPVEGPMIIDMTSSTSRASQASKNKTKAPVQYRPLQSGALPEDFAFSLTKQVDQMAILNEAFYGTFLVYFTSDGEGRDIQNRTTWLHQLPTLSTDGSNDALSLAVRATASAYCGTEASNTALVQNSCKLYGQALNTHLRILKSRPKEITVHMISTSIMLSLFEAMQATTADAYREHITGAARMLEVTGPGQCFAGVLCQLFFHIRTQMAFVYLTTQHSQPIRAKKILLETLQYRRLPMFQRLMSHIATLAEIYVNKTSAGSKQHLLDLGVYQTVKAEVDALWSEYEGQGFSQDEKLVWTEYSNTEYRNPFTALTLAYFAAARILFSVLAPHLACSYVDLRDHYGAVLDCARFLLTTRIGCAYLRMAAPIYLVALHSPKAEQRREAVDIFRGWRTGSMAGISALALETLRKRQDEGSRLEEEPQADSAAKEYPSIPNSPLSAFAFEEWIGQM